MASVELHSCHCGTEGHHLSLQFFLSKDKPFLAVSLPLHPQAREDYYCTYCTVVQISAVGNNNFGGQGFT